MNPFPTGAVPPTSPLDKTRDDQSRDESVSPLTSPRSNSPLARRPTLEHKESQPRIASPLRMEHKVNGSMHGNGELLPSPTGLEPKVSSPADTETEFPFTAPPGASGVSPTNELVQRIDHAPGATTTPHDETEDLATDLAPASNGGLSRKQTQEAGASTPQGRRSVQFARSATFDTNPVAGHSREQSWVGENTEGPGKEKLGSQLLSKLKALAAPMSLQGHGRSMSGWTLGGESIMDDRESPMYPDSEPNDARFGEDEGDADAEESAAENAGAGPSRPKKRRRFRRDAEDGPSTAPTTPRANKLPSFRRDATDRTPPASAPHNRPAFLIRRATMSDIPENQRLAFSEDEGRDRLAGEGLWRRGSNWVQNHRGASYTNSSGSRQRGEEAPDGKRPTGLRRLTGFGTHDGEASPSAWRIRGERTSSVSAAKWRQLKASLKMLGARRREEHRIEHAKSAELMAELLAGAPAALFLASMFQRDEHGNKRIPVLLEQLRVKVTDSIKDEKDKHPTFRIQLEYGSSLARMKWVIHRSLRNFVNLHVKYKSQGTLDKYKHITRPSERSKLPKFPKSAFPVLRGMVERSLLEDEDEDDDEQDNTAGEQTEGEASGVDRLGRGRRRRSSFNFIRKKSSALNTKQEAGEDLARSGSIAGGPFSGRRPETFAERQRRKLEQYMEKMVTYVMFRPDSNRLCKFLELSALGVRLAAEGGYHGKEGFLAIKSSKGVDYRSSLKPKLILSRHTPKWFLVRHSYVVCVDSPEEMNIYEVILVDPDFSLEKKRNVRKRDENPKELARRAKDSARHPTHHQIRITNSERVYKLLAKNERQLLQFEDSINFMKTQTEWAVPHRYESFAPVRRNVEAQFLVDGRDYMWNVSRAISMARDVIYIHDWWLSPELYMRRPAAISQRWRLDRLLKRKAEEGVKIYVIMYRNINSAIPIDSEYSKFSLLDLNDNIFVQRSPNQFRQNTFFWAHHEKICVVDHCVAFCGGVDLCFGRWDTPSHSVVDDKLTGFEVNEMPKDSDHCQLWPGKDYSNPRVQDFYNLDKPYEEMYDRSKIPRMPWHDIGMQIVGQPARDLSRHFVQRWNFILRQRTPSRPTPFLLPPTDFLPADIEALGLNGTCEIQILRSACQWSLGTPNKVECSIMNAYVDMIEKSDHFVYVENQFFISSCDMDGTKIENRIGDALVERIIRAYEEDEEWRAVIIIPLMPGFQNTVDAQDGSSVRLIMQCQYRSICRGETSIFGRLRAVGIEPEDYIEFYALRSWGKIGPTESLVTEQLYIHAKCMIVDDRVAIIGSANINERSMLGSRDSEVAAIVRDTKMIMSRMAGKDYPVAKFAHDLRMRLMREHLGCDVDKLRDEELDGELEQREQEHAEEVKHNADADSIASAESDRVVEQRLIDNKHRFQEELIARQEQLHSFNHDVDWEQANNPHIMTNKKRTTDPRVIGNEEHKKDVIGEGKDEMVRHERELHDQDGRDTVLDSRGREVLVSDVASEGRGSISSPKKGKPRTRTRAHTSPDPEPEYLPPPPMPRMDTRLLGLPQLSQLPELPVTDDTDIGGPPLHRTLSHASLQAVQPMITEMRRPIIKDDCMRDPIVDSFFLDTWHTVAENNTKIFRHVFRCMPDNEVRDWKQYKEYAAFGERFSQAQGMGKSKSRVQQEVKGKSGPPGDPTANGVTQVFDKVGELGEKLVDKLPTGANEKNLPMGRVEDWAEEQEKHVQEKHDEKAAGMLRMDGAASNGKATPDSTTSSKQRDKDLGRQPTITISVPTGPRDHRNSRASATTYGSNGASGGGGGSKRRRRRGTTRSSHRAFHADDDTAMLDKHTAEELLNMVQGTLVVWPYDWLEGEEKGGQWLYAVDSLAPLEIYT